MKQRTRMWVLLVALIVTFSFITRLVLLVKSYQQIEVSFYNIAGLFAIGFFYDLVNAVYFSLPFALYLWLIPGKLFNKHGNRYFILGLFFIFTTVLVFGAVAEYFFWDEFGVRFNFIAVDYLVYTTEVIGNVIQSYPMTWIALGILLVSVAVTIIVSRLATRRTDQLSFARRSKFMAAYGLTLVVCYYGVNNRFHQFSSNAYINELAGNGIYELFAAYINNELDYDQFYKRVPEKEAFDLVRSLVTTREAAWTNEGIGVERLISNQGPEKRLNVVLITVESLSAEYMGIFGNTKHITPFLDSLSSHSLLFTNLYATGTRTVRGLEALSLCVPPTPGQSIVRRPQNEHLFSLGKVFHDKGYTCKYIYGGYGYFDNMNYFFANNEYDVVDRTALGHNNIHYENIWGVADEDLFSLAEREMDQATPYHPVFFHVMTTSNHRPFTYPEGRIDIPSHTGRDGAVKYTDYSIGNFIRHASRKEWFQNTIFIVVADHCASSAGKTELPVHKYHIPMLVYSPKNIQPGVMNRLMSQIDIGPTLLGMMNFTYTSKFFGYDMFKLERGRERAFISTYESLGYLKDHRLVILTPGKHITTYELSDQMEPILKIADDGLVKEAVAWYQTASHSFKEGLMNQDRMQNTANEGTGH